MRQWEEGTPLERALRDVMDDRGPTFGKPSMTYQDVADELKRLGHSTANATRVGEWLHGNPPPAGSDYHPFLRAFLETDRRTYARLVGESATADENGVPDSE